MPGPALTEGTLYGFTLRLSSFELLLDPSITESPQPGEWAQPGGGALRLPWQHVGPPHFLESEIELDALLPGERLFKNMLGGHRGQCSCLIPGGWAKRPPAWESL